jgi:aminopeptidase N
MSSFLIRILPNLSKPVIDTSLDTYSMKSLLFTKSLILLTLSIVLSGCYYKPFIAYKLNKKGFKRFSKAEKLQGDNSNSHRNYHVNRYDWDVQVFPETKRIEGEMTIHFTPTSAQDTFLFDLQNMMKINSFNSSVDNPRIKRKRDLLYLIFKNDQSVGSRIKFVVKYDGKPVNVSNEGPIKWKEDKLGRPWISTMTEGIGPHFIMPCNALLKDEADSCSINVTVPNKLVAVANGRLTQTIDNPEMGTKSFKYEITSPMNIYNISWSVGHFVKLTKPYTDINGVEREIECQVLDFNRDTADKFYDQVPQILEEFEGMFGEFPWWQDGCKFVESNFRAMEHQSGIAMGDNYRLNYEDYNMTLVHEISHEWWGNCVTGYDYCDMWMHEGMATYAEALFFEKVYGKEAYDWHIINNAYYTLNKIPIYKPCDVLYSSWTNYADEDIYTKGAMMMHSLRFVVNNDSLFFRSLLSIQNDFARQNVSTTELIEKFNSLLGSDYSSLFDWYLNRTLPPVFEVFRDTENDTFYYRLEQEIPFYLDGKVEAIIGEQIVQLEPSTTFQSFAVKDSVPVKFDPSHNIYLQYRGLKKTPE